MKTNVNNDAPTDLVDNEKIIYRDHPHPLGLYSFYVRKGFFVAILIAILVFLTVHNVIGVVFLVLGIIILVGGLVLVGKLRCLVTLYTITSQRIRLETGIITRNRDECPLHRIQNVRVKINLIERLLGIGRINIDTASDTPGPDMIFWGVKNPYAVSSTLSANFPMGNTTMNQNDL